MIKYNSLIFRYLILISLTFNSFFIFAKNDSIVYHGFVNLQAMLQTGNLEQFGGNTVASFSVNNTKFYTAGSFSYNYMNVNGFAILNDSWNYMLIRAVPKKVIHPAAMGYYGFAKTFGIEEAFVAGGGIGANLINQSPRKFLQTNLIAGYLTFKYEEGYTEQGSAVNSFIEGNSPLLNNKMEINWKFHGYVSPGSNGIFGFQNNLRLSIPFSKSLSVTISEQMIYNNEVPVFREQFNTMTLFGVSYRH